MWNKPRNGGVFESKVLPQLIRISKFAQSAGALGTVVLLGFSPRLDINTILVMQPMTINDSQPTSNR